MRLTITVMALVLVGTLSYSSVASDPDKSSLVDTSLAVLTGNNSHVTKSSYQRVQSAKDWTKVWLGHLGLKDDTIYRTAFDIDFNRCMVLAIFGGNAFNCCGYRVESVHESKNSIVVQCSDIGYQTAGPGGGADHVTPYAFVVLPKSEKAIVIEEVTHSKNPRDPPVSREVARLNPVEK